MTNIKDAFKRGITASEQADNLRSEADRVIAEFARQVAEAAENKLQIVVGEPLTGMTHRAMSAVMSAVNGVVLPERKRVHVLVAQVRVGNVTGSRETLCSVTFSPGTYPIEVQWDTEIMMCHNPAELTDALNSLVEDPRTGKKFRKLLDEYPRIAEQASDSAPQLSIGSGELPSDDSSESDEDVGPGGIKP